MSPEMPPEIPEPGVWEDEEYFEKLLNRNDCNVFSNDDLREEWVTGVLAGENYLQYFDAVEILLKRKIQPGEMKAVETILTRPNLAPEEKVSQLYGLGEYGQLV